MSFKRLGIFFISEEKNFCFFLFSFFQFFFSSKKSLFRLDCRGSDSADARYFKKFSFRSFKYSIGRAAIAHQLLD